MNEITKKHNIKKDCSICDEYKIKIKTRDLFLFSDENKQQKHFFYFNQKKSICIS